MRKSLFLIYISLIAGLLTACATSKDEAGAYPDETASQIYQHGKTALHDQSYSEAIKRFEALDIQYPSDSKTELGDLDLIYAYYMKEEYVLAIASATRFIQLYPADAHVDYAYYLRGLAEYKKNMGFFEKVFSLDFSTRDLTDIKQAYHDFDSVVTEFPRSVYAASAYQYVVYLRNVLANYELQVGEYYYARRAYVAAADRASRVIKYFEGAPAVQAALVLLAKSYHELGETKLEQDTLAVMRYNHMAMS
ncbi:MAG: hypothetical protein A3F43_04275 [Gammaproteobacteria bacterium RIFCSPHIGHO2_12_FULL_42_10]|nr:MAG: hypothetical protein A3F43_04275 [Gammaproteobacteria bacterium RIFCSPHIGHO2_12_FULL_42_10]